MIVARIEGSAPVCAPERCSLDEAVLRKYLVHHPKDVRSFQYEEPLRKLSQSTIGNRMPNYDSLTAIWRYVLLPYGWPKLIPFQAFWCYKILESRIEL